MMQNETVRRGHTCFTGRAAKLLPLMLLALAAATTCANAQSMGGGDSNSANVMWGTTPDGSGFGSPLESVAMHETNALLAGQALAAERGALGAVGSSITIQSIGSQSVISNTVIGNGNSANITADQNANTNGDVTNTGDLKGMIINNVQ